MKIVVLIILGVIILAGILFWVITGQIFKQLGGR